MLTSFPRAFRAACFTQSFLRRCIVSTSASILAADRKKTSGGVGAAASTVAPVAEEKQQQPPQSETKNPLVTKVFATLKSMEDEKPTNSALDASIASAKTVDALLSLAEREALSRNQVLKVVSILAEWSTSGKVTLSEFETDRRFIRLCRKLGRVGPGTSEATAMPDIAQRRSTQEDDLNTVLAVTGDDDAAKMVANLTLRQMLKVMTSLAIRKRRSLTLIRTISYNISGAEERLDLKQASDLLYALAVLNFPDAVLIDRICDDVHHALANNKDKPAVVNSIVTSLGLLKYRDPDLLEALTEWVLEHYDTCRPQDVSALVMSLATLNYQPTQLQALRTKLASTLVERDLVRSVHWLNHVWAALVLGIADANQVDSVLNERFLARLATETKGELEYSSKMKLLNVNGAARLLVPDYKGAQLDPQSGLFNTPIGYGKDKLVLLNGMLDALKSLVNLENYVRTGVDTKMGFLIDAECAFDEKCNPTALSKNDPNAKRIAIIVQDYHDMCIGIHSTYNGINKLNIDLLEKSGYHVLCVPHTEFSTSDKLVHRVKILEKKIKSIVNEQK